MSAKVVVLAVGRLREKPYREMADEYLKRLGRYGKYEEIEVPDKPEPEGRGEALEDQVRREEAQELQRRLTPRDHVIALTIPGRRMDSPQLSQRLQELKQRGDGRIVFVIGGSLGLGEPLLTRADEELSMSPMTFPHQLARVMLLEQLYRAEKIAAGERYHK